MSDSRLTTRSLLLASAALAVTATPAIGQDAIDDVIARYQFNGDLTNDSSVTSLLGTASPDGVFRNGLDIETATVGTATYVEGWRGDAGSAIDLNGSDDWVDFGTDAFPNAFNPGGLGIVAGTLSMWVNTTDGPGSNIFGIRNDGGQQALLFGIRGNGALYAFPRADNSSVSRFIVSEPNPQQDWFNGEWNHIAIQWDGSLEQGSGFPEFASVYVNGERRGADSTNYFLDPSDAQVPWNLPVPLGGRSAPGGDNGFGVIDQTFDGAVDDFRIFARALSDQEIADMVGDFTGGLDGIGGSDIDLLFSNFGSVGTGQKKFDFDEDGTIGQSDADIWVNFLAKTDYGDVDLDGAIENDDLATAQSNLGNAGGWNDGDVTGDGQVTSEDIAIIQAALGTVGIAGDFNESGSVEQGDLNLVLNDWGDARTFEDPGGTVFATANVDQEELNAVLNNWGASASPSFEGSAVPEPTTLALLGGITLAGLRRRTQTS